MNLFFQVFPLCFVFVFIDFTLRVSLIQDVERRFRVSMVVHAATMATVKSFECPNEKEDKTDPKENHHNIRVKSRVKELIEACSIPHRSFSLCSRVVPTLMESYDAGTTR
jgi:hypothetical protein